MIENYAGAPTRVRGRGALLVIGVVALGLAGGAAWQRWGSQPADSGPSAAIEWNAVQAVPTRAPDAEDVAWERRTAESPVIATPDNDPGEAIQPGLPRASSARNDELGAPTGKIYVIDGDTFAMDGQRIRVLGIDAPETHPPRCAGEARLGNAATDKLRALLGSGTVTMSGSGHDEYGRDLRYVQVNGKDIGQTMIAAGLARDYDGKQRQSWC